VHGERLLQRIGRELFEPPPLPEVLKTMRERLSRFNTEKVNQQDLAKMGGGAADPE